MEENKSNAVGAVKPRMTLGEAVKTCLKKYADFKGRARRSEYWFFYLFYIVLMLGVSFLFGIIGAFTSIGDTIGSVVTVLLSLALVLPLAAAQFRRLHDVGISGWWLGSYWILSLVMVAMFVYVVAQAAVGGEDAMYGFLMDHLLLCVVLVALMVVVLVWDIVMIVLTVFDSKPEVNKYGASPKYE